MLLEPKRDLAFTLYTQKLNLRIYSTSQYVNIPQSLLRERGRMQYSVGLNCSFLSDEDMKVISYNSLILKID